MSVILAKRALPKSLGGAPPPEVAAALAQVPNSFGQLGLASGEASLNIKALRGQPGLYRLRVGDWRAGFVCTGQDFIVSAIGLRKWRRGVHTSGNLVEVVERLEVFARQE